ncbi:hypothetical protein LIER_39738 [Lithospermum erythrorhizon]|uniref:Uncharacterized protein n=1 Tax=Lithospermum erythrorhizon TaxID=34254 RepID=A0AAV3QKC5_LITER
METSLMLIPQIRSDIRRWTAKITITEEIPVMTCSTGFDLRLKRYVFTDAEGNKQEYPYLVISLMCTLQFYTYSRFMRLLMLK